MLECNNFSNTGGNPLQLFSIELEILVILFSIELEKMTTKKYLILKNIQNEIFLTSTIQIQSLQPL